MATIDSSGNTGSVIGFGGISHAGISHEEWYYPWTLHADIVVGDIGKAVTIDTTANARVKLCGDTDIIIGRLESFEDRTMEGIKVGSVAMKGGMTLPMAATSQPAVGDSIQGSATAGKVKALSGAQGRNFLVTAVDTTAVTCTVILL